jgi:hypothetical protein
MTSRELDWAASQVEHADATESTQDQEEEATESTQDEEVRMDADDTDVTQGKFLGIGRSVSATVPASRIVVRDIAVAPAAGAALPADSDAAFSRWLAGSGLGAPN